MNDSAPPNPMRRAVTAAIIRTIEPAFGAVMATGAADGLSVADCVIAMIEASGIALGLVIATRTDGGGEVMEDSDGTKAMGKLFEECMRLGHDGGKKAIKGQGQEAH